MEWRDLRKPLYSGIAARLFISTIPLLIPCDIAGQGNYWADHYNREVAEAQQQFIDDVEELDCKDYANLPMYNTTMGASI